MPISLTTYDNIKHGWKYYPELRTVDLDKVLVIINRNEFQHEGTGGQAYNPQKRIYWEPFTWIISGDENFAKRFDLRLYSLKHDLARPASDLWWQCEACGPTFDEL